MTEGGAVWPTLAAFHADNPRRATSREVTFGSEWYASRDLPPRRGSSGVIFSRVMRRLVDQQRCVLDRVQEAATKGPSEDGCSARALSNRCHRSAQSGRFAKGEGGLSVARPRPAGQSRRLLLNISRSMTSMTTSSRLASKPTSRGSACAQQASNRSSLRCASARGA